jgi:hypothetical protein
MRSPIRWTVAIAALMSLAGLTGANCALAAPTPILAVQVTKAPKELPVNGEDTLTLEVVNLAGVTANGAASPIVVADTLPAGIVATSVTNEVGADCAPLPAVRCEYNGSILPYGSFNVTVTVTDDGLPATVANETSVLGGGAIRTVARETLPTSETPPGFGVEKLELEPLNENGTIDTQAGSHPYQLTTTTQLNTKDVKDLHFELPPGMVGNAQVIPQCTSEEFDTLYSEDEDTNACPAETAIGVVTGYFSFELAGELGTVPLFNLTPLHGEPARFGFSIAGVTVTLDTSVRTGDGYGVVVSANNVSQILGFTGSRVTFWGVPGDPSHDPDRGWNCLFHSKGIISSAPGEPEFACPPQENDRAIPFLTLPTSCSGPAGMVTTLQGDSWLEPEAVKEGSYTPENQNGEPAGLVGCDDERFEPSISVAPDGQSGSTPSGLTVGLHVPQEGALNPSGLSGADVKDVTVELPEGVVLNPAGADGLQACSEEQIGYLPGESTPEAMRFTPGEQSCPDASKIGEATITTPLLPNPLKGAVYLAAQNENPFGSLVAMYIVVKDPVSGVLVKIPGEVSLNGATGQITATIKNNPQLPFEEAELHFFGGSRAPLATPAHCGTYTTNAVFSPWSETEPGGGIVSEPRNGSSSFEVVSGPNGGACPGAALPFAPSLAAGTTSNQAGGFSPLTTTISREDGNQNIETVTLHMPPGVSGVLSGVKLCPEAQANAGTCGSESLIGHTTVSVGLGGDPYSVTGGEVFLTEKYEGAPFGLSIVNPAVAGPFNLGKVIVRAKVEVDPHTAALTITTGAIPHILDGIPLQIKHVNVTIDRPNFAFNPTNCDPLTITGAVASVEGSSSPVSVPFQAANCASLKFGPKFAVSTAAQSTKADGASLSVKLTYPTGPGYANIKSVKVDLPKQLPSRLTTLQKACTAAQFEANPGGCPEASIVGHAKAITPILPVPLEGPAYFVSHGDEAFPSLIVVLQGYGVTVDLVGTTYISKAGITSSTFKTVPDVPVGSFELTLPTGKYSALAANLPTSAMGSFCGQTLAMPTAFVAQNGIEIHESTPISISGCTKAKTLTRAQKLTAALRACKKKAKSKRAACEAKARKQYGPAKKKKK